MKTKIRIFMIFCFISIFAVVNSGYATIISETTAAQVAQNYLKAHIAANGSWNGTATPSVGDIQVVYYKGEPVAYQVNINPSGHMLVAYYDDFSPVIFYSPSFTLDPSKADDPNVVESWIIPETYNNVEMITGKSPAINPKTRQAATLNASRKFNSSEGIRISTAWKVMGDKEPDAESLRAAQAAATAAASGVVQKVGPLLATTWTQSDQILNADGSTAAFLYNEYTPGYPAAGSSLGCTHSVTGCTATAMSQTMKYWNWPDRGVGSNSYLWNGTAATGTTLSANFDHPYDWSEMPPVLSATTTAVQNNAVSLLMSDVGISADMAYTCGASGAYPQAAANALVNNFKYENSEVFLDRTNYTSTAWMGIIIAELSAPTPRPMMLTMYDALYEGHEVVIDGYGTFDGTDMVHVNMGWAGQSDGYYNITSNWTSGDNWVANSEELLIGIQPMSYPLTVAITGAGNVTSNTGTIAWNGSSGTGSYYGGTSVTLTAAPVNGSTFTGWSGAGCSGAGTCVVTMNTSQAVTASFSGTSGYMVTPSAGAGGTLSPGTVQEVSSGTKVKFTVTPSTGYKLASVTGCNGTRSGSTYTTLPITGNCTVSATFVVANYTVTPAATAGGSISPGAPQTVMGGTKLPFAVTPASGYYISAVTGCGGALSGTAPDGSISTSYMTSTYTTSAVTGNCAVSATFKAIPLVVKVTGLTDGAIIANGHAPVTITAKATNNIAITQLYVMLDSAQIATVSTTGTSVSTTATISPLTLAVGIHNLSAEAVDVSGTSSSTTINFTVTQGTFKVTPQAGAGGSISPFTAQTVDAGATQAFTVTPTDGYSISGITGCGGTLSGNTYTTSAVTGNCTAKATFIKSTTYEVTSSAGANGSISPEFQMVTSGKTTTFTVTPSTGYSIASVTGCGGKLSGKTYTTGAVKSGCSVAAVFSVNSYKVTPSAGATGAYGSISPATAQMVTYKGTTTFTATPSLSSNYYVASITGCGGTAWVGSPSYVPQPITYTTGAITANCTVTATFMLYQTLYVNGAGAGSGMVTDSSKTLNWEGNYGQANYNNGTSIKLTAAANSGSTFTGWSGCDTTSGATCTVKMTAAKTVTATFD